LEQKVWIQTTGTLFPNIYTWLVGHPGVGKSRSITLAGQFLRPLEKFAVAPTSVTAAALVDFMVDSTTVLGLGNSYNSVMILADELAAFTSDYSHEMIGLLTTMYDVVIPYGQKRRGKDINKYIERPQLNMLVGTTPSNLLKYMPDYAWDQGFTSRVILIYSNDRVMVDDIFKQLITDAPQSMVHDLDCIRSLQGEFKIDEKFSTRFHEWRKAGCIPVPGHPKLLHYSTRRWAHLLKLSMVSSVDRGDNLKLTEEDFSRAQGWLLEAERSMGSIFSEGYSIQDFKAQDELLHFIKNQGAYIPEEKIVREARRLIPIYAVTKTIDMLERSGLITSVGINARTKMRTFKFND
jgi:hypothetical protein